MARDVVFRTLTAREKQLIKPYMDRVNATGAAYRTAQSELARVLELTEPRFSEIGVSFDYDSHSFLEPPKRADTTLTVDETAPS